MLKKFLLLLGLLILGCLTWLLATYNASDYRAVDNTPVRYANISIVSDQPQRLTEFYRTVFGAELLAANSNWRISEEHQVHSVLRTPGYHGNGPLLTIQRHTIGSKDGVLAPNHVGFAHICFEADDVPALIESIHAAGGSIASAFEDLSKQPAFYAKDPDGNIVEVHLPFPTPLTPRTLGRTVNSLVRTVSPLPSPPKNHIRFLHSNINVADWSSTQAFYQNALGAQPTGFERNYEGGYIEQLTGIHGVAIKGQHSAVPGYSDGGPTLEIFTYSPMPQAPAKTIESSGYLAIGFETDDINNTAQRLTQYGATLKQRGDNYLLAQSPNGNFIQIRQRP